MTRHRGKSKFYTAHKTEFLATIFQIHVLNHIILSNDPLVLEIF